ncbi:hypothetical protein Dtox_3640 [Desulfofarcimen acetoxidans DSM 771]|jgi:hypothetical protein|uniref:Uncharacterized protein n=1 Tax=Desulfofarcimen acetoxidans (strain ATCC 49208 / DSM 771 / KCTC 5769 / VKM B-1644 / 5575) TaxID=485916 RepID=C8VWI7_DESAS|nr:hypothetical protein [Desulfofarcimen acetoxidans]ACV64351.1 hypothetical protein Dtox_3640 [Desulfofarcimen acetoxidans DSM 771]
MQSKEYIEHIFENQRIHLDGNTYRFCSFKNCEVVVNQGAFVLSHCGFENCRPILKGNALNVAYFIELFFPGCLLWKSGKQNPYRKPKPE